MYRSLLVLIASLVVVAGCTTGEEPRATPDSTILSLDAGARDAGGAPDAGPMGMMDAAPRDAGPRPDGGGRDGGARRDAGPPFCGNMIVEAGEACDDGNMMLLDGCTPDCMDEGSCMTPIDLATAGMVASDGSITLTGRTSGARDHGMAFDCGASGGHDLVLTYTPPSSGVLDLSTDDALTDYDTVLHVRTTCGDDSTELVCNDDSGGGLRSHARTRVTAGTPLFIYADGFADDESGTFRLTLRLFPVRAVGEACDATRTTDLCAAGLVCAPAMAGGSTCQALDLGCGLGVSVVELAPLVAADGTFTYTGDTSIDTNTTRGSCASTVTDGAPDSVHALTLPYDAELSLDWTSDFDSVFYVRTTCTDTSSERVCQDFPTIDFDALGPLAAGTRVFIYADGYSEAAGGYTIDGTLRRTLTLGAACDTASTAARCGAGLACRATVPTATAGTCVTQVCGDGLTEGTEQCDDSGTSSGDGCAPTCALEDQGPGGDTCLVPRFLTLAPAGTRVTAARAAGTTMGLMSDDEGSCGTSDTSPDAIYQFTITAMSDVTIDATSDLAYDQVLYVRGAMGALCIDSASELDCRDSRGSGSGETLDLFAVPPGTYYLFVDGFLGDSGMYDVTITATAL